MPVRSSRILPVASVLLLLAGCLEAPSPIGPAVTIGTDAGEVVVDVEVADEPAEWARGLMGRDRLGPNAGMLFIFPDEQSRSFWMKDTRIPLDILYISADWTVVDVQAMTPCTADPCPGYPSRRPAMYALEVNAGFAAAKGVKEGDRTRFSGT
jgi:hypothetical protein